MEVKYWVIKSSEVIIGVLCEVIKDQCHSAVVTRSSKYRYELFRDLREAASRSRRGHLEAYVKRAISKVMHVWI